MAFSTRARILALVVIGMGSRARWAVAQGRRAVDPLCERVLPAVVVNHLTQRADLILIPRWGMPAAGGICNYAAGGKKMVLLVTVMDDKSHASDHYARYKVQAEYRVNQRDVPGLGDAAFTGGAYEHELVARQGSRLVLVASMIQVDRATHQASAIVPRDELVAVAREVIAKM